MKLEPVRVGVVGCGNISGTYFRNCGELEILQVVACSDIIVERAKAAAEKFGIPRWGRNDVVFGDPDVELVICLTPPKVHSKIMLEALRSGKHAYTEKPFAIRRQDGVQALRLARRKGLLTGGAPDTFMGAGIQTCRKLIDRGAIGEPVAATAFMLGHGPENWHPDPAFFYDLGGGPMLDMGPYYLTALISLLGPIRRVTGSARISFPRRLITSRPKHGQKIKVRTPTHIAGVMDFESGAVGTIITSFDCWGHNLPRIEVYGSQGSLSVPDPNTFGGPVRIRKPGGEWQEVPLRHGYAENARGIGPADLAYSLRLGRRRKHRASGELAFHVLDAMLAFQVASRTGRHVLLKSTCQRPRPLPVGLKPGRLDF